MSTFKSEMQRPSEDQVWQMPALQALPSPPLGACRLEPLDEQDTSYLAAAERMFSFSRMSIILPFWLVAPLFTIKYKYNCTKKQVENARKMDSCP
jgi:hypothetical protein